MFVYEGEPLGAKTRGSEALEHLLRHGELAMRCVKSFCGCVYGPVVEWVGWLRVRPWVRAGAPMEAA